MRNQVSMISSRNATGTGGHFPCPFQARSRICRIYPWCGHLWQITSSIARLMLGFTSHSGSSGDERFGTIAQARSTPGSLWPNSTIRGASTRRQRLPRLGDGPGHDVVQDELSGAPRAASMGGTGWCRHSSPRGYRQQRACKRDLVHRHPVGSGVVALSMRDNRVATRGVKTSLDMMLLSLMVGRCSGSFSMNSFIVQWRG